MYKPHRNKIQENSKNAAEILRENGFIAGKIYDNLATIANNLKLPPLEDNIRWLQMGLIAQEIERKKMAGAIAELGVYRGGFSRFISRAFKNRKYYLFDTFEGFKDSQIEFDAKTFNAVGDDFKNTSTQIVMDAINKSNNLDIIFKKGFFPESAQNTDDTFVFVSVDVDLYEPTRDALWYFYPKMAPGGYIMVHDLMANKYQGCRQAVYEFCESMNISFVPLPDAICSALIIK
jgi:O-methyltransferase